MYLQKLARTGEIAITADQSVRVALRLIEREWLPGLIVLENDQLLGVVSHLDLAVIPRNCIIIDCPIWRTSPLPEYMDVTSAWKIVRKEKVGIHPMVDDEGKLKGLISYENLIEHILQEGTALESTSPLKEDQTILIVDDSSAIRKSLTKMLQEAGYKTDTASTGKEALEKIKSKSPDLILLDVHMPRTNSYDVLKKIKDDNSTRNIPVIMLIAMSEIGKRIKAFESGADDYLLKPCNKKELLIKIKRLLKTSAVYSELKKIGDEKKQYIAQLYKLQAFNEGVIESMGSGLAVMDISGKIFKINQAALDILRIPKEAEVLGRPITEISPVLEAFCRVEEPSPLLREVEYPISDDLYAPLEFSSAYLLGPDEEKQGIITIFRDLTEHRKAEEQQRKLSTMIEQSADSIIQMDADFRIIYINEATKELFGWTLDELRGKNPDILTAEPMSEKMQNDIYTTLTSGSTCFGEILNKRKDGSKVYCQFKVSPLFDSIGEIYGYMGWQRDITKRKRAEEALRASEEKYRSLVENSAEGFVITERDGTIIYVNPALQKILGYSEGEFIGHNYQEFLHPRDKEAASDLYLEVLKNKNAPGIYKFKAIAKDGQVFHFFSRPIPIMKEKEIAGFHAILTDITESKRAEEALSQSEERFRIAAECASDYIYELYPTGEIKWFSDIDENFGYAQGEFPRDLKGWIDLVHPDDRDSMVEDFMRQFKTGEKYYSENRVRKKDGEYLIIASRGISIVNKEGKLEKFIGTDSDITERKRAEDIILAQRDLGIELSAASGLEYALRQCLKTAIKVSGMDCGGIYLTDESTGDFVLAYYEGLSEKFVQSVSHYDADSPSARLVMSGEPVYAQYQELGVDIDATRSQEGLRAAGIIPFKHEDKIIGCINVASHLLDEVEPASRSALEAITSQIGNAIARFRAESALKESEERYRELVQNANSIILRMDTNGYVTFFNEFAQRFFGYSEEEILGRNVVGTIVPETDSWGRNLDAMIKDIGKRPELYANNENENTCKDGKRVWVAWTNKPIMDKDGRISEILCIGNDTTVRKRTEDKLREERNLSDAIIDSLPGMFYMFDNDGKRIRWNRNAVETGGYSEKELEKLGPYDFFDEDERKLVAKKIKEIYSKGEAWFESVNVTKNGERIPCLFSGKRIEVEGQTYVVGVALDISERKKAQEILLKEKAESLRLKNLFENVMANLTSGLIVTDIKGKIIIINPAGRKILGVEGREVLGSPIEKISPDLVEFTRVELPSDVAREIFAKIIDGKSIPLGFNSNYLTDQAGEISGIITVFKDLTEINELRDKLREREKLATIGQIAGGIAHEIKNPIFAISSGIQILQSGLNLTDDDLETFEIIFNETMRVDRLIKQLLSYSAVQELKRKPVEIGFLINQVIKINHGLIKSKNIKIGKSIAENIPELLLDKDKITQVLINILQNAIDASEDGGRIDIECWFESERRRTFIRIKDQGSGIPEELRDKIFDLFFSTKKGSSGIGLAISKRILRDHGGNITLEPGDEKGATMLIELPLEESDE